MVGFSLRAGTGGLCWAVGTWLLSSRCICPSNKEHHRPFLPFLSHGGGTFSRQTHMMKAQCWLALGRSTRMRTIFGEKHKDWPLLSADEAEPGSASAQLLSRNLTRARSRPWAGPRALQLSSRVGWGSDPSTSASHHHYNTMSMNRLYSRQAVAILCEWPKPDWNFWDCSMMFWAKMWQQHLIITFYALAMLETSTRVHSSGASFELDLSVGPPRLSMSALISKHSHLWDYPTSQWFPDCQQTHQGLPPVLVPSCVATVCLALIANGSTPGLLQPGTRPRESPAPRGSWAKVLAQTVLSHIPVTLCPGGHCCLPRPLLCSHQPCPPHRTLWRVTSGTDWLLEAEFALACWLQRWCKGYLQALWQLGGTVLVLGPARLQGKMTGEAGDQHSNIYPGLQPAHSPHLQRLSSFPKVQPLPQESTCTSASSRGLKCTALPVAPLGASAQRGQQSEAKHLRKATTASPCSTNNLCSSSSRFWHSPQHYQLLLSLSEDTGLVHLSHTHTATSCSEPEEPCSWKWKHWLLLTQALISKVL